MIIANNASFGAFVTGYNASNNKLQSSMSRLSSGSRFVQPGEAPADLGISERFRAQVRNSDEAGRVIQNAINMMQTTDTWLQQINDILDRMSELAVAAADGSKGQADRKNLDLEFQQLKTEVSRISEAGKYNGLQINGKTAVATYDTFNHRLVYMQPDGSDERALEMNFKDGTTASNGIAYAFESSASNGTIGDFLFTDDGKNLVYIAQKSIGSLSARKTLMKLDLASNSITTVAMTSAGGPSANTQARLVMDEKGRIWVSNPSTAAANNALHNLNLLDINAMSLDAGGGSSTNKWAGGVTMASGFSNFAVQSDYIYFIERSGTTGPLRYVKQSVYDTTTKEVLLYNLSAAAYNLDKGESYAISADGQYIAFEDEDNANPGTLVVINTKSGEKASLSVGNRTNSIVGLDFDANGRLYWTDTGSEDDSNAIKRARIENGDQPQIIEVETIRVGNHGAFGAYSSGMAAYNMGLSVGGGSPASNYTFHIGPDAAMAVEFTSADVRLTKLGISQLQVQDIEAARDAIKAIAGAVDFVANQRAILGAQVSRLNFIFSANQGYHDNIAEAESRIRDVDIARETTRMTQYQVLAQTGISIMAQANASRQNILRLLQ